jgi:hypothetical protein
VALVDPLDAADKGTQGYLRLSITVLGPGDTAKAHDAVAERAAELEVAAAASTAGPAGPGGQGAAALCIMPPTIDTQLYFLVVSIIAADGLPPMDTGLLGGRSIDAFVQVEFAGNPPCRTTVVTVGGRANLVAAWEEEVWVPVTLPTMSDVVTLSVWDEDALCDELVGTVSEFRFSRARAAGAAGTGPRWANLYGAPAGAAEGGTAAAVMRRYPKKASAWCGRLLVAMRVVSEEQLLGAQGGGGMAAAAAVAAVGSKDAKKAKKAQKALAKARKKQASQQRDAIVAVEDMLAELPPQLWPATRTYTLRAFLLSGAELPDIGLHLGASLGLSSRVMSVSVSLGPFELLFAEAEVVDGQAHWGKVLERTALVLPEDAGMLPDVFVYLRAGAGGARGEAGGVVPCCFARMPAAELLQQEMRGQARWLPLRADPTAGGTGDLAQHPTDAGSGGGGGGGVAATLPGSGAANTFPGTLLLKMGLATAAVAERVSWDGDVAAQHSWMAAHVRCHVFQARGLPAADDDGTIDPFVVCRLGGKVRRTRHHANTHDPLFYETLTFDVMLREQLELAPEVILQLWDHDAWTADELVGGLRLPLGRATRHTSARAADLALARATSGGGGGGGGGRAVAAAPSNGDSTPTAQWFALGPPGAAATAEDAAAAAATAAAAPPGGAAKGDAAPLGEVLVCLQLIMLGDARQEIPPPPSLWPKTRPARVEVFALGVRAMQPHCFLPIHMPFVQFELQKQQQPGGGDGSGGDGSGGDADGSYGGANADAAAADGDGDGSVILVPTAISLHHRTAPSHSPSGPEANYLEHITFEVDLPVDPTFAPQLGIKVFDSRLGGFTTPLVGSTSVPLAPKLPWNRGGFVAPQSHYFKPAGPAKKGGVLGEGGGAAPRDLMMEKEERDEAARRRKERKEAKRLRKARGGGGEEDEEEDERKGGGGGGSKKGQRHGQKQAPRRARRASVVPLAREPDWARLAAAKKQGQGWEKGGEQATSGNVWAPREYADGRQWWVGSAGGGAELEDYLLTAPFESYKLFLGQGEDGLFEAGRRAVGIFKGIVRVVPLDGPGGSSSSSSSSRSSASSSKADRELQLATADLKVSQPCEVRVYVLRAFNLQSMDEGGLSDPYLQLKLGAEVQCDREHFVEDSADPEFFRCFTFHTELPGASQLEVELWDMDRFTPDDLIGSTTIDLEDRYFHRRWRTIGTSHPSGAKLGPIKPLENRSLWTGGSMAAQGQVQLWVDILAPDESKRFKPVPIAPPEAREFEVQVVVWKSRGVKAMDSGNMNDLFARVFMEGGNTEPQDTDTHWRCYGGKGSWNWRCKFPITLPIKTPELGRLHLQLWDKDVVKWNDVICETTFDLCVAADPARCAAYCSAGLPTSLLAPG